MLLLISLACADDAVEAPAAPEKAAISWVTVPKGAALTDEVARRAAEAREAGEVPVAYLGAAWCAPCIAYKRNREHPAMVAAHEGVRIIEVDVDDYMLELPKAGFITEGIPFWIHLDEQGAPRQDAKLDGGAWQADSVEGMAEPLKTFFAVE